MKVGDRVNVRLPFGGRGLREGTAVVRELMYDEEWSDGCMAKVEFDDEHGSLYNRHVWEADIVPAAVEESAGSADSQ